MTDDPLADIRDGLAEIAARTATRDDLAAIGAEIVARMATRDDLAAIRTELTGVRDDLRVEISGIRDDLRGEISGIRDDLRVEISGIRDDLRGEISGVRDDLRGEISGVRDELRRTRSEIMARIDRLQDAVALQHEERIVDIGSSERAERLAKAAQQDAAAIGEIVTPLVRLVHGMRTQLDDLAEQVRVLKERPPAA